MVNAPTFFFFLCIGGKYEFMNHNKKEATYRLTIAVYEKKERKYLFLQPIKISF